MTDNRKCSFCGKTATQVEKEQGVLVSMKNSPTIGVCNTCSDLLYAGKADNHDVNSPDYRKRQHLILLGEEET